MNHRVLIVNSAKAWGGGETHTMELARGLKSRNVNIYVLCRQKSQLQKRLLDSEIKVVTLPLLNSIDIYSIYKLAVFLKKEKIDIVHAHLSRDYWLCCLAATLVPQVKIVLTRHVLFPLKESIFHTILLRRVQKIICVAQGIKDILLRHPGIDNNKLVVIPNGITTGNIDCTIRLKIRQTLSIDNDVYAIGVFGSIEEIKGQTDFIEMAKLIAAKGVKAHFFVVGQEKDTEYTLLAKNLVKQYKLENVISFSGYKENVREVMQAMDVVVSTAKFDAFGLVIIEALASGVPTVAYATKGATEIQNNISSLVLVPINNYDLLYEKVMELVADCPKCKAIGIDGAKKVQEFYSTEKMITRILEVYEDVKSSEDGL